MHEVVLQTFCTELFLTFACWWSWVRVCTEVRALWVLHLSAQVSCYQDSHFCPILKTMSCGRRVASTHIHNRCFSGNLSVFQPGLLLSQWIFFSRSSFVLFLLPNSCILIKLSRLFFFSLSLLFQNFAKNNWDIRTILTSQISSFPTPSRNPVFCFDLSINSWQCKSRLQQEPIMISWMQDIQFWGFVWSSCSWTKWFNQNILCVVYNLRASRQIISERCLSFWSNVAVMHAATTLSCVRIPTRMWLSRQRCSDPDEASGWEATGAASTSPTERSRARLRVALEEMNIAVFVNAIFPMFSWFLGWAYTPWTVRVHSGKKTLGALLVCCILCFFPLLWIMCWENTVHYSRIFLLSNRENFTK